MESPVHFIEYRFGEKTTTNDKEFGKLFDMFLLEPERFRKEYIEYDIKDRPLPNRMMTKTENRDWKNGLAEDAQAEGKILVESKDIANARGMADSIRSVPKVCLLYTSPSPRDATLSRMPSSA